MKSRGYNAELRMSCRCFTRKKGWEQASNVQHAGKSQRNPAESLNY
jgi:hypothetical protein